MSINVGTYLTIFFRKFTTQLALYRPSSFKRNILYSFCISIIFSTISVKCHANTITDTQIKTAWLYTIIDWIEWESPRTPITICTIGKSPIYANLLHIKKQQNYTHKILRKSPKEAFDECHILYINSSEHDHFTDLLKKTAESATITVSSIKGFSERGGMIEFITTNKVRPRINMTTVGKANILIDSQIRNWAEIIH